MSIRRPARALFLLSDPVSTIGSIIRKIASAASDAHATWAFRRSGGSYRFSGVYGSFEAAEAALPRGQIHGFNHHDVADYFVRTHIVFNPSDYAVLFWLSHLFKAGLTLFDYGGGIGQSYYVYQEFLRLPESSRWSVCDVSAMAARGRILAEEKQTKRLEFTTDFARAQEASILLTTGTLQYVRDDLAHLLAGLPAQPAHVLLNRVPMYEGDDYCTIQHTQHSFASYKVMNQARFVAGMNTLGYEMVDAWYLPRSLRIPFHPRFSVPYYRGFYFRLKSDKSAETATFPATNLPGYLLPAGAKQDKYPAGL
jgi:putative methyltransferase (TIGR04325 family)